MTASVEVAPARTPAGADSSGPRLESVDLLRGLVMVLMALDHTRDFFHAGTFQGVDPLDLARTTLPLYFTRWLTHFCAPVFVFLAGTGASLSTLRGRSKGELSRFLFTRGLWLVLLELTWIRWLGWTFTVNLQEHAFLVIWAIGWSMVTLAVIVQLPAPASLVFGLVLILGHNAFDHVGPAAWGRWGWAWQILHAGGSFEVGAEPGVTCIVGYPLIPWLGVMAAGYSFGGLWQFDAARRRRWLIWLGAGLTLAFVVLRFSNVYGDRKPWSHQASPTLTVLSFLDCHKYPPSLCYLLMTLGPAILVLAWLERGTPALLRPILVFGRVPLFYYLLHLPLIHAGAVAVSLVRHGGADWLYGRHPGRPPPDAGFNLFGTYLAWLAVLLILYPACRWFAELKRRRREVWLSYL